MVDLKIGGATFENVDRIQLNKADLTGVVNFMEASDFLDVAGTEMTTKNPFYENPYLTTLGESGAAFVTGFTTVYLENVQTIGFSRIQNALSCIKIILPKVLTVPQHFTYGSNVKTELIDLTDVTSIENHSLGSTKLSTVIIRGGSVPTVNTTGQKATGVTLYVPSSMIASYQADTNWAALFSGGWSVSALENSAYASPDWFRS